MKLYFPGLAAAAFALAAQASAQLPQYTQDFESLNAADGNALTGDGWLVFGNVFDPGGGYLYGYGPFGAPNGGGGFSEIASGAGGASQGLQYINVFSDYNNSAEHSAGNYVEANVFQEFTVDASNEGETWTFEFDYLKNGFVGNGDGDTTTIAFIKVLDPGAGFATIAFPTVDTTGASTTAWATDSIDITIGAGWAGNLLQIGFASTATAFNDSGRFYDNVSFSAPGSQPPSLSMYSEDFEALNIAEPTALGTAGWRIFANVFDPSGGYLYGYGVFDAPNGGAGFSAIATGSGGAAQGSQYLNAYNDYGNSAEHTNGNTVNALLFQEQPIGAVDVGTTWRFAFDQLQNPTPNNGNGNSTTGAFVKVIKVSDSSFATLFEANIDTTDASTAAWLTNAIDFPVDASYAGEIVQFGFQSSATSFEDTGRFYDNITWGPVSNPGLGTVVCLGNRSSTGVGALLTATGSLVAADNDLTLTVTDLPLNQFGIFVRSSGGIVVYNPASSEGHLCIASLTMGRFNQAMLNSGATGSVSLALDLTQLPGPNSVFMAMAGDTEYYQYWTRDMNGGSPVSNFSSALEITFQ